ncbi:hypothetical protein Cgig2_005670 [Carnegiea gigantea]|uniref:Reverse transcriptase zinc-binding domain-containing protein n=1 Tax=Carnegiea gigantea TaxID=171969 RepID=A0A9Q1KU84_9CARY|nr:hypothetical protein Cgig2_005670 [Carnegiea gigantea]
MQIDGPFPEYIEFFNEDGVLLRQHVTYEWIPSKCTHCAINATEDDSHLFSSCSYAAEVWDSLSHWWPLPFSNSPNTVEGMTDSLARYKAPKAHRQISYAIFAAGIYFIWYARNQRLFKNHRISASQIVCTIKEQIRHRFLFLNTPTCNYSIHIDVILG